LARFVVEMVDQLDTAGILGVYAGKGKKQLLAGLPEVFGGKAKRAEAKHEVECGPGSVLEKKPLFAAAGHA